MVHARGNVVKECARGRQQPAHVKAVLREQIGRCYKVCVRGQVWRARTIVQRVQDNVEHVCALKHSDGTVWHDDAERSQRRGRGRRKEVGKAIRRLEREQSVMDIKHYVVRRDNDKILRRQPVEGGGIERR